MSNWFQRRWEARDQQVNQVSRAVGWYPDRHQFAVERQGPVWSQNWRKLHAGERPRSASASPKRTRAQQQSAWTGRREQTSRTTK